jgi:hypothetical protein
MCLGPTSIILSPVAIKLSIASLDDIRKRFDSHSSADVQACVDALYARNRDVVEKEIADSGLPRDQAMAQAMEEGRQSCLPQVRENLRVLAQGDLLHKQITSVFIMDYSSWIIKQRTCWPIFRPPMLCRWLGNFGGKRRPKRAFVKMKAS